MFFYVKLIQKSSQEKMRKLNGMVYLQINEISKLNQNFSLISSNINHSLNPKKSISMDLMNLNELTLMNESYFVKKLSSGQQSLSDDTFENEQPKYGDVWSFEWSFDKKLIETNLAAENLSTTFFKCPKYVNGVKFHKIGVVCQQNHQIPSDRRVSSVEFSFSHSPGIFN